MKFFYLVIQTFAAENRVDLIRDSYPSLVICLPSKEERWMKPIFQQFFKNRAQVEYEKPMNDINNMNKNDNNENEEEEVYMKYKDDENDNLYDIPFKFTLPKSVKLLEKRTNLLITRLQHIFEHEEIILQPHQQRALDKMWLNVGKKVFTIPDDEEIHEYFCYCHSMGSGKSFLSLATYSRIPVTSVKILTSNAGIYQWAGFVSAMAQPIKSKTIFEIIGITEFAKIIGEDDELFLENEHVILDEVHIYRNYTPIMQTQIEALRTSRFLQTLSGTLVVNSILDLNGICQVHQGDLSQDELTRLTMDDLPTSEYEILVKNILTRVFSKHIDYYQSNDDPINSKHYAPYTIIIKEVPMKWEQTIDYMVKKRNIFELNTLYIQTAARNSYHIKEKHISNSMYSKKGNDLNDVISPKFDKCCSTILEYNKFPQIIYSNYLDNGIKGVHARLKRQRDDLTINMATGTTPTLERDRLRQEYNHGKMDLLFLSKIGNATLDFAGSKALHLLDSFDNKPLEDQAIGRVRRFKAHKNNTEPIVVFKYISTFPKPNTLTTQQEKDQLTRYFYDTYCNPNVGSLEELIPFDFTQALIEKIQQEENYQTIDQKLEISNQYKVKKLQPAQDVIQQLGTE